MKRSIRFRKLVKKFNEQLDYGKPRRTSNKKAQDRLNAIRNRKVKPR